AIAIFPLTAPHWWERDLSKLAVSLLLGIPTVLFLRLSVDHGSERVAHAAFEYVGFMALLGSLYIVSGGILLTGKFSGSPRSNTMFLAAGAVLANLIGTTGASMVLIRPLLRANETRPHRTHLVIFFIFLVSNVGGLLTPLGDPPLFLGYLRGVPFEWTFRLWKEWIVAVLLLLIAFWFFDQQFSGREERKPEPPPPPKRRSDPENMAFPDKEPQASELHALQASESHGNEPRAGELHLPTPRGKRPPSLQVDGWINVFLLGGVLAAILLLNSNLKIIAMAALALASVVFTPAGVRAQNRFSWDPILEVAIVFAGIFATMVPALMLLEHFAPSLPIREPWHFFWATGILSSFLDNAPTYLSFASAASGLAGTSPDHLNELIDAHLSYGNSLISGEALLTAIAVGAVFMGANTYIGNGPNFMVKAIAEQSGIRMPSFVGYMKWSAGILIPLFILITFLFFRG
ncbi:MAG TPA: sodium:proton antiporter, partial [bacterium]|nr:sodium:proton antiporter [bacterium]